MSELWCALHVEVFASFLATVDLSNKKRGATRMSEKTSSSAQFVYNMIQKHAFEPGINVQNLIVYDMTTRILHTAVYQCNSTSNCQTVKNAKVNSVIYSCMAPAMLWIDYRSKHTCPILIRVTCSREQQCYLPVAPVFHLQLEAYYLMAWIYL